MRLTGPSDKTAKALAQALLATGFLVTDESNRATPYRTAYFIAAIPTLSWPLSGVAGRLSDCVTQYLRTKWSGMPEPFHSLFLYF